LLAERVDITEEGGGTVARILIIEDDPGAAEAVAEKVASAGLEPIIAHTAAEGRVALETQKPRLVVLDLMLPDGDGLDVCREIRRSSNIPIIMLTAKTEEVDRIIGLEIGADDYVLKPFSPKELVSRIRAVLRRLDGIVGGVDDVVYDAGGLVLNALRHEVTLDGQLLQLTPIEYRLLLILMKSGGQVVERQVLTEAIWGYEGYSPNLLEIHIGNLRRKIEQHPRHPRRLITVRSFGYKLMTDIEQ
jgi:DNA-binding response OmpR family regulator